jgi:hypothetical protein
MSRRHVIEDEDVAVDEREAARRHVRDRRHFTRDVMAYLVINAALIALWAANGAGYFWPAWVLAIGGVVLLFRAWDTFARRPMTEDDIEAEMQRHHH